MHLLARLSPLFSWYRYTTTAQYAVGVEGFFEPDSDYLSLQNNYNHLDASQSSSRTLKSVVARALGGRKHSTYRTEAEVSLIAPVSPAFLQSECDTLVDFDMSPDDEDDTITLWGGNDYSPSRRLSDGHSHRITQPSQAFLSRKDKGSRIIVDRSQMLDPEDRTWEAPQFKLKSKLGFASRKNSQQINNANNSQRRNRFPEAEVLDADDSSWM
ncbi:hypothetical protein F5050DRAFT_1709173 [Lentinula boryana]|uniref:Uncharacterized protein n=1 Tax=Lentinula boryana TaxID=40481 RepID=A0ABQ8QP98_9AGAR|nr:hypothetical protein F5050DRAFT_1709173 [Lentinula boryana]